MIDWFCKTTSRQITTIIFLGFTLYSMSLLNGFVADDNIYIVNNPFIHTLNPLGFFLGSSYYSGDVTQLAGIYYKPIFTLVTSLLFTISGGTPFLFHLIQVCLHITNVILLYFLFNYFFSKRLSFFLALVFLIHPGNTESVVYIADLQDVLFPFFGLSALLVSAKKTISLKRALVIGTLLLMSLLSKESGILFLLAIISFTYVCNKHYYKLMSVISMLTFFVYLFLRFTIAHVYINNHVIAPIMAASFETRLLTMPKIIASYITLFFFPNNLSWGQHWVVTNPTPTDFFVPITIISTYVLTLILFYWRTKQHERYGLLFFISMLVFGLGLHLQFIPLDFTFAERWAYFPMIGFVGILGYGIQIVSKRTNKTVLASLALIVLLLLFTRTFIRTFDWKDDFTLASHDIHVDTASFALENNLGYTLILKNQYEQAIPHLEKSLTLYPDQTTMNNLAMAYTKTGQKEKSLQMYQHALHSGTFYMTDENYIAELIRQNKYDIATKQLTQSLATYPNNPKLWLLRAIVAYDTNNLADALLAAKRADELSPGIANFIVSKMQRKEKISL